MSQAIPTIRVKSTGPKGHRIINESSFDPSVHELFTESSTVGDLLTTDAKGAVPDDSNSAPCPAPAAPAAPIKKADKK